MRRVGSERGGLGSRAVVGKGGDNLLQGLVVEVIRGPARDLLSLDLLSELHTRGDDEHVAKNEVE